MLDKMKYDGRVWAPQIPETARYFDYNQMRQAQLVAEVANATTAVGKLAIYWLYFAIVAQLADKKQETPAALKAEVRNAYARVPVEELVKVMKAPRSAVGAMGTSKAFLRDEAKNLMAWNRRVKEMTRIPESERKLLTMALRISKEGVSDSAIKSAEKLAWVLSPDLGAKVTNYLHPNGSRGPTKDTRKGSASGVAQMLVALKAKVKDMTGISSYTVPADGVDKVKAKSPAKYEEYNRMRRDLRNMFQLDWRKVVVANDNKPMDVDAAEKAMVSLGYEPSLFMPTRSIGYTGKLGLYQGKMALYTQNDRLINGSVAPGSKVTMNKNYAEGDDEPYYLTSKAPGAVTKGSRLYTVERKRGNTVERFNKAEKLATNLPSLLKKWQSDVRSADAFTAMQATAALVLYLTGARIGSSSSGMQSKKGVAAYGILSMRAEHVKTLAGKVIFDYQGKKGVHQKHEIKLDKPTTKIIGKNLQNYVKGKKKGDLVWTIESVRGRSKTLTYPEFNRYIKSMGFTQGAHKLRHVRGTELVRKILDEIKWKPSRQANTFAKRKKEAETFMKDEVLTKVAHLLGHKSMKGGKEVPLWRTSITSYVMPNIVRSWFEEQKLDVPNWVPEKVGS